MSTYPSNYVLWKIFLWYYIYKRLYLYLCARIVRASVSYFVHTGCGKRYTKIPVDFFICVRFCSVIIFCTFRIQNVTFGFLFHHLYYCVSEPLVSTSSKVVVSRFLSHWFIHTCCLFLLPFCAFRIISCGNNNSWFHTKACVTCWSFVGVCSQELNKRRGILFFHFSGCTCKHDVSPAIIMRSISAAVPN